MRQVAAADTTGSLRFMELVGDREASAARPPVGRRSRMRARLTLIVVSLGVMMVGIDGSVVSIANPFIARSLHASLADLQWVTNAYLLVARRPADRRRQARRPVRPQAHVPDRRRSASRSSSVAIGLVGSITGVIAFRVLQGAFGAILMPNTLALLRSAYSEDDLTRAVGHLEFRRRSGYRGRADPRRAAGRQRLLGERLLPERPGRDRDARARHPVPAGKPGESPRPDRLAGRADPRRRAVGADLRAGQGPGVGLGRRPHPRHPRRSPSLLLVGFVYAESRASAPLLPLWLFKDRSVSMGSLIVLLNFFALFGVLFFVSLYLQSVSGYSALSAGLRTLPLTAVFSLSSPLGARITTRYGPRVPIGFGLLVGRARAAAAHQPRAQLAVLAPVARIHPAGPRDRHGHLGLDGSDRRQRRHRPRRRRGRPAGDRRSSWAACSVRPCSARCSPAGSAACCSAS